MEIPFPPQCKARYRPDRLLASGGFGAVYLATQLNLDRRVAIKLLKSDILQDPEQIERFLAEAKITAALSHQNVVMILDHAVEDGVPWIAYEFLPGRNVRGLLENGALAPRDALTITTQVASALARAHAQDILHRDIKPENVLEVEPGYYKVTDFGIAKWTRDGAVKTRTGVLMGTPVYMAPELMNGVVGPAADQYALGIMFHELMTGAPPFVDDHPMKILVAHVEQEPPPPSSLRPGLPAAVDAVCRRVLAKDPGQRYPSCLAFKEALEELVPLFAAGKSVGKSGVVKRPPQETAANAAPMATAANTAPVSMVTAAVKKSGPVRQPSRKITSTVAVAAPARDRRPMIAGGVLVALAVAAGAFALRPAPRPSASATASPVASPEAVPSPVAVASPAVAPSPVAIPAAPLPAALVAGKDGLEALKAKIRGSFELVDEPKGVSPLAIWGNMQFLQDKYRKFEERGDDDWFEDGLQRHEASQGGCFQYWVVCVKWRASRYRRVVDRGGWSRVAHDALAMLTAMRQPRTDARGTPTPPFEPWQTPLFAQEVLPRYHWRAPLGGELGMMEWKLRVPLHVLPGLYSLYWRRAGQTITQVSPSVGQAATGVAEGASDNLMHDDKVILKLTGLKSIPTSPESWLAALDAAKPTGDARRLILVRAALGCLVDKMRAAGGFPLATTGDEPVRPLVKHLIRADFADIHLPAIRESLAAERLPPHPAPRPLLESTSGERMCTARLEAAALAGMLVDWLSSSVPPLASRGPDAVRPLARALVEALEWRLALVAATPHPHLVAGALAELEELRPSLESFLEKADRDRLEVLVKTARPR